jgi:NADPH:quinone reductase-like Zn-dependent oxidoreductase
MRAVLIRETGDAEVLRLEELDRPEPDDGEVLIRVRAVSINPIDWKYRQGMIPKELPAVLGSDISGTVERSRAEGFAEGDEVFGFAASGAYAEFATSPAMLLAHKPAAISHEQAAAIPVGGLTAWQALFDRGALQQGQSALIAGAAGGVGHFAVQFAKHVGARAIGTGSARSRDFVIGLGAAEFVDYTSQDVADAVSGVDVAFDTVGGETTQTLLPTVRDGGVLITIAGAPPEQAAAGRVRTEHLVMSPSSEQLATIAGLVAAGEVHVEIAEVLPLAEVQRAHALSESGRTRGKIILSVGDSPH